MQQSPLPARCRLFRLFPGLLLLASAAALVGCGGMSWQQLVGSEWLDDSPSSSVQSAAVSNTNTNANINAGAGHALRVMTLNVRRRTMMDLHNNWPNRRGLLIATVRQFNPDLLGTQEVEGSQARELSHALRDYDYVGVGRDNGAGRGEQCAVFFKRDRFRLLESGHFWLSDEPYEAGSRAWGAWFPRMVTWVKLETRGPGGRTFYFFNTHFSAMDRDARHHSAALMRQEMARITNGTPAIVTGDFNAPEGSRPYRIMTRGLAAASRPLIDTYREAQPMRAANESTRHGFDGDTEGARIDWIMASAPFQTHSAAINRTNLDGRYPSDHFPVQAILHWPAPAVTGPVDTDRPDSAG